MPSSANSTRAARWWALLAGVAVVVIGCILAVAVIPNLGKTPGPTASPQASAGPPGSAPSGSAVPTSPSPGITETLPGAGRDPLYVQSATEIVRYDLASGRRDSFRTEDLSTYANFVAGDNWAVWKGIETGNGVIPGVVVRQGERPAPLPASLRHPGIISLADRNHFWWLRDHRPDGATRLDHHAHLFDFHGKDTGTRLQIPPDADIVPDPAGHLLVSNTGGVYQLNPDGPSKITAGNLLAVGKTSLLVWDCNAVAVCGLYVADRSGGRTPLRPAVRSRISSLYSRADLAGSMPAWNLISPDGRFVALVAPAGRTEARQIYVVDLHSGATTCCRGR